MLAKLTDKDLDLLEHTIQEMQSHKVRITPQRRAILSYLISSHEHPSAEMIYQGLIVDHPGMSLATVYNTLNLFAQSGFIRELASGDACTRYDFISDEHYHLICMSCGKIQDIELDVDPSLVAEAEKASGYLIHSMNIEFKGICPECQKNLINENN